MSPLLLLVAWAIATPDTSSECVWCDAWHAEHVCYGLNGCAAAAPGHSLAVGQRLMVFTVDRPPMRARIDHVRAAGSLTDSSAGAWVNCGWASSDEERLNTRARLEVPDSLEWDVMLAVADPPAGFLSIGGRHTRLAAEEAYGIVRSLADSIPAEFRRANVLVDAYRYGPEQRHDAVELYLGIPERGPDPGFLKSVRIRRSFLVDGHLLAGEEYSRQRGVEERVDTEGPALRLDDWAVSDVETTLGYLSHDQGHTWERVSTNIGAEGIWWIAERLEGKPRRLFAKYLYTPH